MISHRRGTSTRLCANSRTMTTGSSSFSMLPFRFGGLPNIADGMLKTSQDSRWRVSMSTKVFDPLESRLVPKL